MRLSEHFRQHIWQLLNQIPSGTVVTYGQLAAMAGEPNQARAVGNILKQLPPATKLPWHRVVNFKGEITFPPGSQHFLEQKQRLEAEGIIINNNRINLKSHRWQGE